MFLKGLEISNATRKGDGNVGAMGLFCGGRERIMPRKKKK